MPYPKCGLVCHAKMQTNRLECRLTCYLTSPTLGSPEVRTVFYTDDRTTCIFLKLGKYVHPVDAMKSPCESTRIDRRPCLRFFAVGIGNICISTQMHYRLSLPLMVRYEMICSHGVL